MNTMESLKSLEGIEFLLGGANLNKAVSEMGKTVAIVGNSGKLLKKEQGSIIDSHDVVIRFNHGPTAGYEKYVGSKTTLRLVNCHTFNVLMGFTPLEVMTKDFPTFDPNFLFELKNQVVISKNLWPKQGLEIVNKMDKTTSVVFVNPVFLNACSRLIEKDSTIEATSGFLATLASIVTFGKVSCFGFSFYEECWDEKHYFEKMTPYELNDSHSLKSEKSFIMQLAKEGYITFV